MPVHTGAAIHRLHAVEPDATGLIQAGASCPEPTRDAEWTSGWSVRIGPGTAFTLIEMMLVILIVFTILGIAIPNLKDLSDRARTAQATNEVALLQTEILAVDPLPTSLADIGRGTMKDPWGRPYQYLNFSTVTKGKGNAPPSGARKDRFLVPINSTFDLYSMGADGASQAALTAKASRDDVIRAADGAFIGLAIKF